MQLRRHQISEVNEFADNKLFERLKRISSCDCLPSYDYLFSLADNTALVLENEAKWYRPVAKNGKPGALLDFNEQTQKPVIVIPDLHARAYFLQHILEYKLPTNFLITDFSDSKEDKVSKNSITVFEALSKSLIRIVCVGDLLHSELRGKNRWLQAESEFYSGNFSGTAMCSEMKEGLSLLSMVMELKCAFSDDFHILKGNHENILNETGFGNFSFVKFSDEGEMCKQFIQKVYGDDVLYIISCFEKTLPLLACFSNCIISHAEPAASYSREDIIEAYSKPKVIRGLTWTENGAAASGSVESMIAIFADKNNLKTAKYIAGHRPVKGLYALRQNGNFIQIHNPEIEQIALIYPDKPFDPDSDLVRVEQ